MAPPNLLPGMLCPMSPPPPRGGGPPGDGATSPGAGGGQPGLQVMRTEAVVPPTLVHQGEPAMASASAQHSELSRVTGSLVGGVGLGPEEARGWLGAWTPVCPDKPLATVLALVNFKSRFNRRQNRMTKTQRQLQTIKPKKKN